MEVVDLRRIKPPDEISPWRRKMLFPVLAPLSVVYGGAMWLWRRLPARSVDLGIPVISIGSLSVGGTGKTPLCMLVAQRFAGSGRRACVISRGYRRRQRRSPLLVSDGRQVLATVEAAGDEAYMMAKRLRGIGVAVGKDRYAAALEARRRLDPDVLVLDDGFQCRHLVKHVEIVCLDRSSLCTGAATLPLGVLREGWSAIKLADLIVIVLNPEDPEPRKGDCTRLGSHNVFFAVRARPVFLDHYGKPLDREELDGRRNLLISGIARPETFEIGCLREGVNVVASMRFEDHHWYVESDVKKVTTFMEEHACSHIVTTEKDFHKLPARLREVASILRMDLALKDEEDFWGAVDDLMGG
jgi:tetraacyldisaccharide 4'-kinase